MAVKQLSVYLEDTTGRLSQVTQVLADAGIDFRAAVIAGTTDFGVLRCIVKDPVGAQKILTAHNFNASLTDVICVSMADRPGAFNAILQLLASAGISVRYIYSTVASAETEAVIMVRVSDTEAAEKLLSENGIKMYNLDDIK